MPADVAAAGSPQFVEYLQVLRRRKWTIIIVTVLAVGAAIGFSKSQTPIYQASAKVLLVNSSTQPALGSSSATPPNLSDEIQRLQSPEVAALVRQKLGTAPTVSGHALSGTDIMVVTASSRSPATAALVANAYANAYIQQHQTASVASYLSAAKVIHDQISVLNAQIAALNAQVRSSTTTAAAGSSPSSTTPTAPPATTPNPQVQALITQVGLLQQQINNLQTQVSIGTSGVQLLQPAVPPTSPSTPRTARNALLGLGGGLVLGIALAFVRESLDDTISSKEDLDRTQPGLPVLGMIPAMSSRSGETKELVSSTRPHSYAAEAYRSLRTSVQFLALDQPIRTIQVTSPRTSEGKTTSVANLAVTLAAAGQRVIVADCDLRRPRQHEMFGIPNQVGFTSVLLGDAPISDALQAVPDYPDLFVLTSGARPPNPAELLSSPRVKEVFGALARLADVVLVDTPPVLPVTDAVLVSGRVDATVLVVSAGLTSAKDLSRALEVLGQVDAPVTGAVLNAVTLSSGYRYRYQYSYTPDPRHLRGSDKAQPDGGH
jgi:non-specific protein-tyrosine kinase